MFYNCFFFGYNTTFWCITLYIFWNIALLSGKYNYFFKFIVTTLPVTCPPQPTVPVTTGKEFSYNFNLEVSEYVTYFVS